MFLKTLYLSNIFFFGYIFLKNRKLFFENGFKHTPFLLQFKMKSKGECRAKCQTIEGNVGHGPNSTLILIPFLLAPEVNWKPRLKTKEVHSLFFLYVNILRIASVSANLARNQKYYEYHPPDVHTSYRYIYRTVPSLSPSLNWDIFFLS